MAEERRTTATKTSRRLIGMVDDQNSCESNKKARRRAADEATSSRMHAKRARGAVKEPDGCSLGDKC